MIYFVYFIKEQFKSIYYIFLDASGYPDAAPIANLTWFMLYLTYNIFILRRKKSCTK